MKSPNGQYEVERIPGKEVRMDGMEFGRFRIKGASFDTSKMTVGNPIEFSPDSRFLAVAQLVGTVPGPHSRALIFDFEQHRQIHVHDKNPGVIIRFAWSDDDTLTVTSWTMENGEREFTWRVTSVRSLA